MRFVQEANEQLLFLAGGNSGADVESGPSERAFVRAQEFTIQPDETEVVHSIESQTYYRIPPCIRNNKTPAQIPILLLDPLQLFEILSVPKIWYFSGPHQRVLHRSWHFRLNPGSMSGIFTCKNSLVGSH